MKKVIASFTIFFSCLYPSYAQPGLNKNLFIIDSIPVLFDPSPSNELWDEDIASSTTLKNTAAISIPGKVYPDSITYIFTKEYMARAADVKQIPSLSKMEMKENVWKFNGIPYTGPCIDYYYSGKKSREGALVNGRMNGEEKYYFQNGKIAGISTYRNGKLTGAGITYFLDESVRSKGFYNDDERWIGESYFPNGQIESRSTERNNDGFDSVIMYLSSGKIKQVILTKDNHWAVSPEETKKLRFIAAEMERLKKSTTARAAKKIATSIINLDSANTDAYIALGTFMFGRNKVNEAIEAFSKALEIEPLLVQALMYRCVARMKKYAPASVPSTMDISGISSMQPIDVKLIPAGEKEKICADLVTANSMRNIYQNAFDKLMIIMTKKYCGVDIVR